MAPMWSSIVSVSRLGSRDEQPAHEKCSHTRKANERLWTLLAQSDLPDVSRCTSPLSSAESFLLLSLGPFPQQIWRTTVTREKTTCGEKPAPSSVRVHFPASSVQGLLWGRVRRSEVGVALTLRMDRMWCVG